jgi:hypothetical protein
VENDEQSSILNKIVEIFGTVVKGTVVHGNTVDGGCCYSRGFPLLALIATLIHTTIGILASDKLYAWCMINGRGHYHNS